MFGVISSTDFFPEVEKAIFSLGEQIVFNAVGADIDIVSEFEKLGRIGTGGSAVPRR